jgi:hypothetical protein
VKEYFAFTLIAILAACGIPTIAQASNPNIAINKCVIGDITGDGKVIGGGIDFKNNTDKVATAIRFTFVFTTTFNEALGNATVTDAGTFSPGIEIDHTSQAMGPKLLTGVGNRYYWQIQNPSAIPILQMKVACKVNAVSFEDGSTWAAVSTLPSNNAPLAQTNKNLDKVVAQADTTHTCSQEIAEVRQDEAVINNMSKITATSKVAPVAEFQQAYIALVRAKSKQQQACGQAATPANKNPNKVNKSGGEWYIVSPGHDDFSRISTLPLVEGFPSHDACKQFLARGVYDNEMEGEVDKLPSGSHCKYVLESQDR